MTSSADTDDLRLNTTPNILTGLRVLLVPLVVGLLYWEKDWADTAATVIFVIAAFTDYFDGYLARKQNLVSLYGQLMDPLADKFLVVSSLVMLQQRGRIWAWVVIVLICRELMITSLRALASTEGVNIKTSDSAKWKTATQMVAIPFLMHYRPIWGLPTDRIGYGLLSISVFMSLWSAQSYIYGFFKGIREGRAERKKLRQLKRRRTDREDPTH